jgi:hypothetical protein
MNTFAGFWRDGAVVKPASRHYGPTCEVVSKRKSDGDLGVWQSWWPQDKISEHYWLDTTTPTELTPQEAFELLKTITPTLERIEKHGNLYSAYADERISIINWGSLTEYPPRERWRVPTDADKGKRCRFKSKGRPWLDVDDSYQGTFLCIAKSGFVIETGDGVSVWACCEVLE